MEFFLNDRSLHGQFPDVELFLTSFKTVMSMRKSIHEAGHRLFADKAIQGTQVTEKLFFYQAIDSKEDKNLTRAIRGWLSKSGPFWQQIREHSDHDYFDMKDDLLTNSILAEAAWRYLRGQEAQLVSFAPSNFQESPIVVEHHESETPKKALLRNYWDPQTLSLHLKAQEKAIKKWDDWVPMVQKRFRNLVFGEEFTSRLKGETFSRANAALAMRHMEILDRYVDCIRDTSLIKEKSEIERTYFSSEREAWFSLGSDQDEKYNRKMMFKLPGDEEKTCCQWHSKLSHNCWRMHFDSPHNQPVCIVYLGYKLAKN